MEEIKLNQVVENVSHIKVTQRAQGLVDLKEIFRKKSETNVENVLSDKAYHKIFESVFKAALAEKLALTKAAKTTRTSILKRLVLCGEIVRLMVSTAGSTLRGKTLEAVLNHIWQTLLEPDGGLYEHLAHYYLKALNTLFEHQQVVESLRAELWLEIVDSCLQIINHCVDIIQGDSSHPTRTFSSLGSSGQPASLSRNSSSGGGSSSNLILVRQNLEELFQCLMSFVSAPNGRVHEKYKDITTSTIRFLHLPGSSGGQVHHWAFSVLNAVVRYTRIDHSQFSQDIALQAIPEICRIWRGKSMTRDTMLNNLRSEILVFLLSLHLHLERSVREANDDEILNNIEELADVLRTDYAKRSEEEMLMLDHLTMSDFNGNSSRTGPFTLFPFHLMLHSTRGERDWGILQAIGVLERIVAIGHHARDSAQKEEFEIEDRSRKRQRVSRTFDRTLDPLKSSSEQILTAGLQWLPFILEECQFAWSELRELIEQLTICAADKRANIASWALLALSSCTNQESISDIKPEELLKIWHIGAKAITFSNTCRAACLLLHSLIARNLVGYQDIGADIDSIISAHDTNSVTVLCDSSIALMSHLLHVKISETPGTSSAFSQKVIRWVCARWKPADREYVARYSSHVQPQQITDLFRTCMGLTKAKLPTTTSIPFEAVAQAWQLHLNTQDIIRYLLLLPKPAKVTRLACPSCPPRSKTTNVVLLGTPSFYAARKLVIELTRPKCGEVLKNWRALATDRSGAVSTDTFRSGLNTCITMALIMPYLKDASPTQVSTFAEELVELTAELLLFLNEAGSRDTREAGKLNETLLQSLEPYLPVCDRNELRQMIDTGVHMLRFIVAVADNLSKRHVIPAKLSTQADLDDMDIDDEPPREEEHIRHGRQKILMPRRELALSAWSGTFYRSTIGRLALVTAVSNTPGLDGFFPPKFIDYLLGLDIQDTLSSRPFLREVLMSDLRVGKDAAHRLLVQLGNILSSNDFGRSEVAFQTCLDVLRCLWEYWLDSKMGDVAETAAEIYQYFINVALGKNGASPDAQKGIADLLLLLLRENPDYGMELGLKSSRSNLLDLLRKSNASVKFHIGSQLSQVFGLFLLKDHDNVFVDIQDVLPSDPDWLEGISLRLYVFAKLASSWPNLLRRCIYHIFETAGRLPASVDHSSHCLLDISSDLKVEGPRKLFSLFAPQILYTWLETENIDGIPFKIFGFPNLKELVENAQEEAVALMVMREQERSVSNLASMLEVTKIELIGRSFTKVIAYSIAHDISIPRKSSPEKHVGGDVRVKNILGSELFHTCIQLHFADIMFVLFNLMDQEGDVERHLHKKDFKDVAETLKKIKMLSSSDTKLPANQQPTFKAKFLTDEIEYLLRRTPYDSTNLYTDALVTSIARKLISTIHPALGSLHACSVLRKLRVLISLAGKTAIDGYPLEMLLQSVRPWITITECADDAIGVLQYLLENGSAHLRQTPTLVAGLGLSTLCSLRVFLESQRASTTQEIQHKSTMSKAQKLHAWTGKYMLEYDSPLMSGQSKKGFRAIMESASRIDSVGNVDNMTPESKLLMLLLEDEKSTQPLLSGPARQLVMEMLTADFRSPSSFRADALGTDQISASYAGVLWKSCRGSDNKQYLSWAARVLGRAFASTGVIHEELLRESTLFKAKDVSTSATNQIEDPRTCIMKLLGDLTLGYDPWTIGLAEVALRNILTIDNNSKFEDSTPIAESRCIPESLQNASFWNPYDIPPSESPKAAEAAEAAQDILNADAIFQEHWLRDLAVTVAQSVPSDVILGALVPILRGVTGFANRAFPFVLHLVLSTKAERQKISKKQLSKAFVDWFASSESVDQNSLKMLLNCILYLRTQPLAGEKSSADRAQWLDINYLQASIAATHCGMFKTSLLFVEEYCNQPMKSARRSSSIKDSVETEIPTEILLRIFENVDDPDMYYGVQQHPSLKTILARFEYERDGAKSLSFRGATYDSHVRRRDGEAVKDVQSLVRALGVLNLDGLSHSLLQAQQTVGMTAESLESMFHTARKLEQWDIPVPTTCSNNAVTIYKAYQAIDLAIDQPSISQAINEGLEYTMRCLVREDLSASALHGSLQTLAALVEMDEVLSSTGSSEFEEMLKRFEDRSEWMQIGRFEDITQILSCRGTTLSTLSQRPRLHQLLNLEHIDTRLVEVQTALLSSKINRAHSALQESLSLATAMIDLIRPCNEVGIMPEVAIHVEAANALWDQGEMISSIGMLQGLDDTALLKKQTVKVGRSDLLSKIGYQVSVARLEKADKIIDKFLKPALKELKGQTKGAEAGHVFHQFAMFCDQQLQDPDSIEDLERLRRLRTNKANEVQEYESLILKAQTSNDKARYKQMQSKARIWLKLDDEELQRHSLSRDEFLRQCLDNYLLALYASDDNDSNALRFAALWLEHSEKELANTAVSKHIKSVPSKKFAPLMNQLTSRLQDSDTAFQKLLFPLICQICMDHPYHGMYQIYAGTKSRINERDESAVLRKAATDKVIGSFINNPAINKIWTAVERTNRYYCALALEKNELKYKAGKKLTMAESRAAQSLNKTFEAYSVPPPTVAVALRSDMNYSKLPMITQMDPSFSIASGVSAPKIVTVITGNGRRHRQLVKGGNDDLRQDAIMEQVFEQVSALLKTNRSTRQRNLSIRTYKVLPLTNSAGLIEFVANTIPLHEYLMPAHERYYPKDLKGSACRNEIGSVSTKSMETRVRKFREVTKEFHPVMRFFFTEKFTDPDEWFAKRLAYSRSTAAISILGHVLGLGDRHGHNILLDSKSGEVVHIDLGVAFEMGRVLPVPELVPFRLTRDIVDGMGITKTEGVFRRCCEFTLEALRKEVYSIMTILDVLRYDPLYSWSISPIRLARLQEGQSAAAAVDTDAGNVNERGKETVNEPGEADRSLTVVNKKLSKTLSVTATVNDLINQAMDERNLAVLYSGWAAYA